MFKICVILLDFCIWVFCICFSVLLSYLLNICDIFTACVMTQIQNRVGAHTYINVSVSTVYLRNQSNSEMLFVRFDLSDLSSFFIVF